MKRTLLAVVAAVAWAGSAEAGSVKQVSSKKKLVTVELGEDETMEKDADVCVFSEANKKIACGTVVKVKGTLATVKFETIKGFKKMKPGLTAKVGEEPPEAKEGGDEEAEGDAAPRKKGKNSAKEPKVKSSPFRVWFYYSPALATPAVYNKLGYAAPTSETPDTLWSDDKKTASTLFGLNLQVGIPLGAFSLNPGLRYRKFTPSVVDSDYTPQRENPYASTEETASATGVWVDFQLFRVPFSGASSLWMSSGVDMDMSTVILKTTKKDDSGATAESEIAKASSKLNVISLRVGAATDIVFAQVFGLSIGTTIMVPLSESAKFSGDLSDGEARGQAEPGDDLKKALGHKKNSVAYELSLGSVLAF